jgi:pyrroline-5-carboxylate reductase
MKSIAVIGCGNMGSATVAAVLHKGICLGKKLVIIEKVPNAYTEEFTCHDCLIFDNIKDCQKDLEVVILAVKPQFAHEAMLELVPKINANTLVISLMAGISIHELNQVLGVGQIIRAMPNTPCSMFLGMTVYCCRQDIQTDHLNIANRIFSAMGVAMKVDDERKVDAATAISGTGPAYLFFLAESLKKGAMEMGFDEDEADILANQTLLGAANLLHKSDDSADELRRKVTSRGGTTEAAMKYYHDNNLMNTLVKGYKIAHHRSLELGGLGN